MIDRDLDVDLRVKVGLCGGSYVSIATVAIVSMITVVKNVRVHSVLGKYTLDLRFPAAARKFPFRTGDPGREKSSSSMYRPD